jgi:hypothetical protein
MCGFTSDCTTSVHLRIMNLTCPRLKWHAAKHHMPPQCKHMLPAAFLQALPREFTKWGTLKQRLREVKQSAQQRSLGTKLLGSEQQQQQRHITHNSDDSSTVISGTCSDTEEKIEQLLAQPLVPTAAAAAPDRTAAAAGSGAAGAAAAGASSTLNLVVRRCVKATVLESLHKFRTW